MRLTTNTNVVNIHDMDTIKLHKAIEILGGQCATARALGVRQSNVWNWINRDKRLPAQHCIPLEAATEGRVTRYDLRPDVFKRDQAI